MKSMTAKLSLVAIAAALVAPAFAAGTAVQANITAHATQKTWVTSAWGTNPTNRNIESWDVSTKAGEAFLALCIEPGQSMVQSGTQSYTAAAFTFTKNTAAIERLYGVFYGAASSADGAKDSLSFQLALWELNNDDSNLSTGSYQVSASGKNTTSTLYAGAGAVVSRANDMLTVALGDQAYTTKYTFTKFSSDSSQDFVAATAVSAVPEPSTYAMLGLGLGLVGFAARRRNKA